MALNSDGSREHGKRVHGGLPREAEPALILDNAKRSVSIRINTSDYGRIKTAARRMRTREAEIFRYLLQVGLTRISPLLGETLDDTSYLRTLAELGPDFPGHFGIGTQELTALLQAFAGKSLPLVDESDLELIEFAGSHPRLATEKIEILAGRTCAAAGGLRPLLFEYLKHKYAGSEPDV